MKPHDLISMQDSPNQSQYRLIVNIFIIFFFQFTTKSLEQEIAVKEGIIRTNEDIIRTNEDLIRNLNMLLEHSDNELMRVKGLLTSRGIFERYVELCISELLALYVITKRMPVIPFLNMIADPNFTLLSKAKLTTQLVVASKNCSSDLVSVYDTLSKDIHGLPWSGRCVRIFANDLSTNEIYLLKCIAGYLKLDIQEAAA